MRNAVIGLLFAGSVAGGCASTREPVTEIGPVRVTLDRAAAADMQSPVEAGGIVRARATALIASRVMAPITQITVRTGDRVRRGSVLVRLDAREIEADQGRAVATAVAAVEVARAADADVQAAESALILARATHERMAGLYAKRSATAEELDRAVATLTAAEAQRTSAKARLASANAAREAAQESAQAATIGSTYTVLSAPFDGIVTERHADPGSMAMPGTPLLTLEDPAIYRLEVQVDEARAALVGTRQTVSVRIDTEQVAGAEWIDGRVEEIARVDPASHSFVVKIALPSSTALRSGLFGRARFAGPTRRTLTVPRSALVNRGQLTFVYVVDADHRARLRPLSPGAAEQDRVEVLAGLRESDLLVTNPPAELTDGSRVTGGQP